MHLQKIRICHFKGTFFHSMDLIIENVVKAVIALLTGHALELAMARK